MAAAPPTSTTTTAAAEEPSQRRRRRRRAHAATSTTSTTRPGRSPSSGPAPSESEPAMEPAFACTPEGDDPWSSGSLVECCEGSLANLEHWVNGTRHHYCHSPSTAAAALAAAQKKKKKP